MNNKGDRLRKEVPVRQPWIMFGGNAGRGILVSSKLTGAERAWCLYDWANSAFVTTIVAAVLPAFFAGVVCPQDRVSISFKGIELVTGSQSLWGYAMSFSALLVAIGAPVFGAAADAGGRRKLFLGILAAVGISASALLALSGPGRILVTLTLVVAGQVGFAGANVFYNSLLVYTSPPDRRDRVSSRGYAMGYLGGGLLLALNLLMIREPGLLGIPSETAAVRLSFVSVAVWWAVFSIPLFRRVPGGPAPEGVSFPASLRNGLRALVMTFRNLRRHRNAMRFLISFLLYNDGVQTIILMATVFGRAELGLDSGDLIGALLLTQFVGVPGSLLYGRLAERIGARRSILAGIIGYTAVVLYAWRMTEARQFTLLAIVVGLLQGGIQAISRSFYSRLIPQDQSSEYFGFFSVSSRFASIFGPLIFALISDLTGSGRNSILAITAFFIAGGILLLTVRDPERV